MTASTFTHSSGDWSLFPDSVPPGRVLSELRKHIVVDGFQVVIDLEKSRGRRIVDAVTGNSYLDMYSFFASMPIGFNHPYFDGVSVREDLIAAATCKVANSDVYSVPYAEFVSTLSRVMGLPPLERYFFIEGGAAAVENTLKAAMDWKVRKNLAAGKGERGTGILHFERAFHGRSGYTLGLTNTDPSKTNYFAKFDWPRVPAPCLDFTLPEGEREDDARDREAASAERIEEIFRERSADIAAIITEPIQAEGGDRHFRREWFWKLRDLCDRYDVLLIFDEVQTGLGMTGRNWCCEHFDVLPDMIAFGKKAQVCGVMAGPRLDEVEENCFRIGGRINSTWGGNLVDMVRATHFLRIIERENLVENAREMGACFLARLREVQEEEPLISRARGCGLMLAFDLPTPDLRDAFWKELFANGLLALCCGERSIRFRPVLDIRSEDIDEAIAAIRAQCRRTVRSSGTSR